MAGLEEPQILPPFQPLRQELQPTFCFSIQRRLRRDLAAISGPPGPIILRYGKTTPYIVLLGSLAVRMAQATLVAAIAVAVQFAPATLLSAEEVGTPALKRSRTSRFLTSECATTTKASFRRLACRSATLKKALPK
jgi:hypothetical protein